MKRLREVLERVAPPGVLEAGAVLAAWAEVARSSLGEAYAAEFRGGRLTVYAAGGARAQELSLRAHELARKVNQRLGRDAVREVRVRAHAR